VVNRWGSSLQVGPAITTGETVSAKDPLSDAFGRFFDDTAHSLDPVIAVLLTDKEHGFPASFGNDEKPQFHELAN
jgi:hypothetical protein